MKTLLDVIIEGFVNEQDRDLSLYAYDTKNNRLQKYGSAQAAKDAIADNPARVDPQRAPDDVKADLDGKDDGQEPTGEPTTADTGDVDQIDEPTTQDIEKLVSKSPEENRESDATQVDDTLRSTKQSLKQKVEERKKLSKSIEETLKEKLDLGKSWIQGARASGEQLTMVGANGTEETKPATEWVDEALSLRTKNVGLGTDESRAGESAVVWGLSQLVAGSSFAQIRSELQEIASVPGSILKKDWITAGMKTIESLADRYGIENIEDVAWDTKEGNELVGSTGHGTSADMFIRLKPSEEYPDGKSVGVSLKKNFDVFFMNGGLVSTLTSIMDDLSPEARAQIADTVNVDEYFNRRRQVFADLQGNKSFSKKAIDFLEDCQKNGECGNLAKKDIQDRLPMLKDALSTSGDLSIDQMKILARVANNVEGGEEYIKRLRGLGNEYTNSMFEATQRSEEFRDLMKKKVIKGLHITETLGIDLNNLDEFMTSFGGEDLTLENMSDYFLASDEDRTELNDLVSSGDSEEVERFFMDRLDLSIDEETGSPMIRFKRSSDQIEGEPQFLSIADAGIRERGIGESPTFELGVSNELKYVIKYGANMENWPTRAKNIFMKSRQKGEQKLRKQIKKLVRDQIINTLKDYGN